MKKALVILLFLKFVFLFNAGLAAQEQKQTNVQEVNKTASQVELQFLKDEINEYRKFIQQEREEHQKFLESYYDKTLDLFYILGIVIIALVTIFGLTSIWQIKKSVNRLFSKYTLSLISRENEQLKISIDDLKNVVNRETLYLNKRILFLCSPFDQKKLERRELQMIYSRGIKKENLIMINNLDEVVQNLEKNSVDLLLYYYNPIEQKIDQILHDLIDYLKKKDKSIPLIVYNFEKPGERGQLFPNDSEKMRSYPYHLAANFPITLVNQTYSTINYILV